MAHQPNTEQARNRFIERVANAYFQTWAGYGYHGERFTFAKATEYAATIADHCFPLPTPPMVVDVDIDDENLREILMRSGPPVVLMSEKTVDAVYAIPPQPQEMDPVPFDPDTPCGDGVSGD